MIEWRPQDDPPNIPLTLIAHEDFVRDLGFDGQVNSFPVGTTITLVIYPDSDPASAITASWPATVNLAEATAAWSVDRATVDALTLTGGRGYYRLMLALPNPATPANAVLDRCLALGKLNRK